MEDHLAAPMQEGPDSPPCSELPTPEELTALLPQYETLQVVGVGGMGAVYLSRQVSLDRWVALKVLPLSAAQDEEEARRFMKEARAMARLAHPHIVSVFDFGQTPQGHLFLAMEFVEGGDLHWRIRSGEMTPERARAVIAQLCEALQFAHEHGVIHRDIKPANILITNDWQVKVVDFGLAGDLNAAPGSDEAAYGTPDYVSPERLIVGAQVDHRADVYSLGVVIHELLTGLTPKAAGSEAGKGLPPGFAGVLSKCLMHDPARRYQSAAEVRQALLNAAREVSLKPQAAPAAARRPAAAMQPSSEAAERAAHMAAVFRRRKLMGNVGWTLACLIALGALVWMVWRDHYQPPEGGNAENVNTQHPVEPSGPE